MLEINFQQQYQTLHYFFCLLHYVFALIMKKMCKVLMSSQRKYVIQFYIHYENKS